MNSFYIMNMKSVDFYCMYMTCYLFSLLSEGVALSYLEVNIINAVRFERVHLLNYAI